MESQTTHDGPESCPVAGPAWLCSGPLMGPVIMASLVPVLLPASLPPSVLGAAACCRSNQTPGPAAQMPPAPPGDWGSCSVSSFLFPFFCSFATWGFKPESHVVSNGSGPSTLIPDTIPGSIPHIQGVGPGLSGRAGPPGALGHPSARSLPLSSRLPLGDREARGGLKSAGKAPGHQVAISFTPSFTPSCSVHPTLGSLSGPRPSWSPGSSCIGPPPLALGSLRRPKGEQALSKDMQRGEVSKVLGVLSAQLSCILTLCPRLQAGLRVPGCEKAGQ